MARAERDRRAADERRPLVDRLGEAIERDAAVCLGPDVDDLRAAQLLRVCDLPDGRKLVVADDDPVPLAREIERGDERADTLRDGGRDGHVVGLGVHEAGERRSCRLVALDPVLPLGAVLVPAGKPLLGGGANAVRERALRARVRIDRVLEDRELVPNGHARRQTARHVSSDQGRPCAARRAGGAPTPSPRERSARSTGHSHDRRSRATRWRSARR